MSRTNLDNIKTYHQLDSSDLYENLAKFGRHFEKGFHESQINPLPLNLDQIKSLLICTDGASRHLADFCLSLTPFFLKVPFEINTNYRLPNYANENTLVFLLSTQPNSEELSSILAETELKKIPSLSSLSGKDYQNLPHTLGFLFGFLSRLNPAFSKTLKTEKIFSTIERTVSKLNRDLPESQNPAKALAQKHAQKAVILLGSGHLQGVSSYTAGLITRWAKTFSTSFTLPEANGFLESAFTYPTKVLNDYQILVLSSDLYSQTVLNQLAKAKNTFAKKRINFSLLKPDASDWFGEIFESLVFCTFFSYYLSITNKVNL